MDPIAKFARRLRSVEKLAFRAATQPQLAYSSIEDGAIQSVEDGSLKAIIGKQFDGTQTVAIVNGPTPPTPSAPGALAALEGALLSWDGLFADGSVAPMDFTRVEVHASTDPAFTAEFAETLVGTFETPRGGSVYVSLAPVEHYVRLVARSESGARSDASVVTTVTPQALADSLPDSSDGAAPASSPLPVVQGGVKSLFIGWDLVDNPDRVTYEVHVSDTSGFTPDSTTLSGETDGMLHVIRTLPGSTDRLSHDVTYYVRIIAKDIDGAAAPSAEVSAQPIQIETVDVASGSITANEIAANAVTADAIAANSITADKILANSITAEKLSSLLVLASRIEVGSSISIDPTTGITINLANGGYIKFPANGNPAELKGVILQATELVVDDKLTINGAENKVAGSLTLNSNVPPPAVAPTVTNVSDPAPVNSAASAATDGGLGLSASGYTIAEFAGWYHEALPVSSYQTAQRWYVKINIYDVNAATGAKTFRTQYQATNFVYATTTNNNVSGDPAPTPPSPTIVSFHSTANTAVAMLYFPSYTCPRDGTPGTVTYAPKYSMWMGTFSSGGNITYGVDVAANYYNPAVFTDDTYAWLSLQATSNNLVETYKVALNGSGGFLSQWTSAAALPAGSHLSAMYVGSADFGASRVVLTSGSTVYVYNGNARDVANEWTPPEDVKGLVWTGGRFWSRSAAGRIRKYSTLTATTSRSVTYTWYNTTTGGESTVSPATVVDQAKRSWLQVTTSSIPTGTSTAYPDAIRQYFTNHRQAAVAAGVVTATYEIPDTTTGAAAPTTDSFAALGNAGTIKSAKTDAIGPVVLLKGDGSGRVGPLSWDSTGGGILERGVPSATDTGWIYVDNPDGPAFQNGATPYGGTHAMPRFRRIGDIVYLEGLISNLPGFNVSMFTLPAGFRPDGDIIPSGFGNGGTEGHGVRIFANGNVVVGQGVSGWTSIVTQFPVAGGNYTWHQIGAAGEPAFGAGWSNLGSNWQTGRFTKIGDYVYMSGVVQRTSGSNITIFTLPTGYTNTNGTTHTPCACASAVSGGDFGVNIDTAVKSRAAGSNTGYVSLAGIKIFVGANDSKWKKFRGGADGWYNGTGPYGAPWPTPAIRRDGKVIFFEGLSNISATGSTMKLPWGYAPGQQLIVPVVNSSSRRLDVTSPNNDEGVQSGSALQFSATGVNGFTNSWVVAETFE